MLIYDKKDGAIDLYRLDEKDNKVAKYKKDVLQRHKNSNLFYGLKTNNVRTLEEFNRKTDMEYYSLNYDDSTVLETGYYSQIYPIQDSDIESQRKKDFLESFAAGYYDALEPKRVFAYSKEDGLDHDIYRLLLLEQAKVEFQSNQGFWQISSMLNLPPSLFLLQLLRLGKYDSLISKDISDLLELFDIDYLKSINISDIEESISTGLLSGTKEEVIKRAETGSIILQKVRKPRNN